MPVLALIATFTGLVFQQYSDSRKREEERYEKNLQLLGSTDPSSRVAAIISLTEFAAHSQPKAEQIVPVLVHRLTVESRAQESDLDEAVLSAVLRNLPKLGITAIKELAYENNRIVMHLSRASAEYVRQNKTGYGSLRWIGLRIVARGLPFETEMKNRFVPIRLEKLIDFQRYGNSNLQLGLPKYPGSEEQTGEDALPSHQLE